MPSRPTILLILSFPAGAIAYVVATQVVKGLWPNEGFFILIIPLFIAGLVMMPLIIPWFDRRAKADLAAYRRTQEPAGEGSGVTDPDKADEAE